MSLKIPFFSRDFVYKDYFSTYRRFTQCRYLNLVRIAGGARLLHAAKAQKHPVSEQGAFDFFQLFSGFIVGNSRSVNILLIYCVFSVSYLDYIRENTNYARIVKDFSFIHQKISSGISSMLLYSCLVPFATIVYPLYPFPTAVMHSPSLLDLLNIKLISIS